jgi:hypothetical protein
VATVLNSFKRSKVNLKEVKELIRPLVDAGIAGDQKYFDILRPRGIKISGVTLEQLKRRIKYENEQNF